MRYLIVAIIVTKMAKKTLIDESEIRTIFITWQIKLIVKICIIIS